MIESLTKHMNSRIWKVNPRDINDVPFQYNLQRSKLLKIAPNIKDKLLYLAFSIIKKKTCITPSRNLEVLEVGDILHH